MLWLRSVLNTDNMSILGDTIGELGGLAADRCLPAGAEAGAGRPGAAAAARLWSSPASAGIHCTPCPPCADYGPYGFLERFDPDFTPNTTDLPGRRYCFRCARAATAVAWSGAAGRGGAARSERRCTDGAEQLQDIGSPVQC